VEVGRPYYRAFTAIDTLALIEPPPEPDSPDGGSASAFVEVGGCYSNPWQSLLAQLHSPISDLKPLRRRPNTSVEPA